ncbi:MAG: host attachment protein [Rhodospirillales bacterium]
MKPIRTWVVVADGARAVLLLNEGPGKGLTPLTGELRQPAKPTREIGTDRPGRVQESADSSRHAMEPRVDWHRFEKQHFAEKIAAMLDTAAEKKEMDRIVLVAPAKTLGDLRKAINGQTAALVRNEVAKDLTNLKPHELVAHLGSVVVL